MKILAAVLGVVGSASLLAGAAFMGFVAVCNGLDVLGLASALGLVSAGLAFAGAVLMMRSTRASIGLVIAAIGGGSAAAGFAWGVAGTLHLASFALALVPLVGAAVVRLLSGRSAAARRLALVEQECQTTSN